MVRKPLIAIVGRPNVGKSTLFNRMTGRRKALVQDVPGITRDRQYGEVFWDRMIFTVLDTGGLEFGSQSRLQRKMSGQALVGVSEADIIVSVMDARSGVTSLDREWVSRIRKIEKPKIFVANKVDSEKMEPVAGDFFELGIDSLLPVSAETGRGVSELLDRIANIIRCGGGEMSDEKRPTESIGEELTGGEFKIAIIGRPNVGKSTLLNALLGKERSITDEAPGTTRDPVNSYLVHANTPFCLVDTAGIRKKGRVSHAIEKFSIIKSLKAIDECNLALLLVDTVEGVADQDAHVAGEAARRGKAIIFLANKWDEGAKTAKAGDFTETLRRKLRFASFAPVLYISAKTGLGLNKIFPTVLRLRQQYEHRVLTSAVNDEFARIVDSHPLPLYRGRNVKIYYAAQAGIKPPTFVIFANEPRHIHFSYERYLANSLREAFGFREVPVRIVFRKSD